MEIEARGGNCIVITYKKEVFVTDPKLSNIGLKDQGKEATTHLLTQTMFGVTDTGEALIINGPGEYEVRNCSIVGVAAQAHMDTSDMPKSATIYKLVIDDITIAVLGHIYPSLSEDQLERLGLIDILIIPIGGNGYTLDAKGAVELIRSIDPKIVIPTHYQDTGINYPMPQNTIDDFLKELGAKHEVLSKLRIKGDLLAEGLTVYQLMRR